MKFLLCFILCYLIYKNNIYIYIYIYHILILFNNVFQNIFFLNVLTINLIYNKKKLFCKISI